MAEKSSIEWTNSTWNPITGCTKISPGCDFCYAERFSERFRGVKDHPFQDGFDLSLRPKRLHQPLSWLKPRMIFVNSMSDLFHKEIPTSFIDQVFDTMEQADWHIYQILTKRSVLMRKYINKRYRDASAPEHIWIGVSVEDAKRSSRIRHLYSPHPRTRKSLCEMIRKLSVMVSRHVVHSRGSRRRKKSSMASVKRAKLA